MVLNLNLNQIKANNVIAVALSGGEDSVCLLFSLIDLRETIPFTLKAINIEHGIRNSASLSDTEFCKKLCAEQNIEIKCVSVNAPNYAKDYGYTLEQAARILRYNEFLKAVNEGFADKIAVAHHQSDDVETVLFNLFRGTALKGVCGISDCTYDGKIIRPLINVTKKEIRLYVDYRHLSFVTDETNSDNQYKRNYIRNVICPEIEKAFPSYLNAITRFSNAAKIDDDYLQQEAKKFIILKGEQKVLRLSAPKPLFYRAAISCLKSVGVEKDYTKAHLDSIFSLTEKETGAEVSLPYGITAVREYECVRFYKNNSTTSLFHDFSLGEHILNGYKITVSVASREEFETYRSEIKSGYSTVNNGFCQTLFFDGDKICDAQLRLPQQNDKFTKFGGGTKSLTDYLTDKKLSKLDRRERFIVAKDSICYIICGIEISDLVKVDKHTANVLKLVCSKN